MRKMKFIKKMLWMFMLPVLLFSCESKMDEHYETPSWLKGSAWEILESEGNYSIFLKGVELAGFKQIVAGKNILTIMAPNDDAFKAYLQKQNLSSIEDMSLEDVKKLIGFHIMYYAYNTTKLTNFRPEGDGSTESASKVMAGMYYKHRTKSIDPTEVYHDIKTNQSYTVYHTERFLPVFSYEMFKTKGIDAKSAYEYFYPNSTWTGDQSFNVSNASLVGGEIVADNGYLYKIDQVLEPLETIYNELKGRPEYSKFLALYNNYSYFIYDEEATKEYGNGDSLYYHKHNCPADIACEWPVSDYRQIAYLSAIAGTIFAPSNEAIDDLFQNYWKKGGYEKLEDVSPVAMQYVIYNSVYGSTILFPEEIKSGKIMGTLNTPINFDVTALPEANRKMCSNGVLYGMNVLQTPPMFNSVTGPAFQNKDYSYYLYMLDRSGMAVSMSSEEAYFTALLPENTQMESSGYTMVNDVLCESGGDNASVGGATMQGIVNVHTTTDRDGISASGTRVIETNKPFNYWYVKDGKLTTTALFNQIFEASALTGDPDPYMTLTEVTDNGAAWSNGKVYTYDYDEIIIPVDASVSLNDKIAVLNDENYKYYYFAQLLKKANMVVDSRIIYGGKSNIYFIPTNEAFKKALTEGRVPGVDASGELIPDESGNTLSSEGQLRGHMLQYIVSLNANNLSNYPYLGSGLNGFYQVPMFETQLDGTRIQCTLEIIDDGQKLSVRPGLDKTPTGPAVDVVDTYDYFPFAYGDGCVHFLEDVLTSNK